LDSIRGIVLKRKENTGAGVEAGPTSLQSFKKYSRINGIVSRSVSFSPQSAGLMGAA
jgi:hypothetical protein